MPIRTKYKLRAERPKNIIELHGYHALTGRICLESPTFDVLVKAPIPDQMLIGFFYPHAKVKTSIKAIKPLRMDKTLAWRRPDTEEILMIQDNVETHFSRWIIAVDDKADANCQLDYDSGIRATKDILAGSYLRMFMNGWVWIRNSTLPQYKKFKAMKRNYGFNNNEGRKKIRIDSIKEVQENGKITKSFTNYNSWVQYPLFKDSNELMGIHTPITPPSSPELTDRDIEELEAILFNK